MELDEAIVRFRGPLVGLVASWGVPFHDAVEIAEDSFADAHINRDACRGDLKEPSVYGRWLRGVARNHFRNWLRSHKRRDRRVVYVEPSTLEDVEAPLGTEDDIRVGRLREAIDHLPEKQRCVVLMHYLEETSVRDVAMLLSVTPKAVEGRLYQARKSLARMLSVVSQDSDQEAS
ncbi:RNA polymerase sigma factor [Adhaeretor mobilis]|uniref:RNA polymerase sigma factor n=1 Tax=Adhaeretor mobilis TaxID=1930276 RepID=UPI001C54D3EC|nr:RNA polymerase sigma factor [Adhaeretor mobilis]